MSSTMLATAGRIAHRLLQHNGLEADAMFLAVGLDPLKLDDPQARYPLDRIRALWRMADAQFPNPCWGLTAGELWRPTDFHALGYAFLASATLASAFKRMERYFRILNQDLLVQSATTPAILNVAQKLGKRRAMTREGEGVSNRVLPEALQGEEVISHLAGWG